MSLPIVSIIVPTTNQRKYFNERILNNFIRQDYERKHLLFDFEEGYIGTKRNRLCEKAYGEIIVNFDSDDAYASDWITKSVNHLIESKADITGLANFNLHDPAKGGAWRYRYSSHQDKPWLAGATMCYWKSFWEQNKFPDKQIGEDAHFLWDAKIKPKVFAHNYIEGFLATVHEDNTAKKTVHNAFNFTQFSYEEEEELKRKWKEFM